MSTNFYCENQIEVVFPFLRRPPRRLFLGGPGYGNEGQRFVQEFFGATVFAFEPCKECRQFQQENGGNSFLWSVAALSDKIGKIDFTVNDKSPQQSSFVRDTPGRKKEVMSLTLDYVHKQLASMDLTNDVLWLDIEGAEVLALRGAEKCLTNGAFQLINLEVIPEERPDDVAEIEAIMARHGFELACSWGWMGSKHDRIYVRK